VEFDALKLENQLCFPLYAAAKEVTKKYRPYLEEIGLTYTQYIAMMVLWEKKTLNVKALGESLFLDSGTLTPLLKKLEASGLITRNRSGTDERSLKISITSKGEALKEKAKMIPGRMAACINVSPEEAKTLYYMLYRILKGN
jgi:DNA-binding MarR family transcriptional regulator